MPYAGKRLQPGEIRILTLHSGWRGEPILCSTRDVSLEQAAQDGYSALSYAWGPPTQPQVSITVNETDVLIGQQLYQALEHLRDPERPRTLWVDALCINQTDAEEKTAQLPLMARIYSGAATVEIWLGPAVNEGGDDEEEWAMRVLSSGDRETWRTTRFFWAASKILDRPWFDRLWILQEFVLGAPGALRIRLGGETASWADFRSLKQLWLDLLPEVEAFGRSQYEERARKRAGSSCGPFMALDSGKEESDEPTSAMLTRMAPDDLANHSFDCYEVEDSEEGEPNKSERPSPEQADGLAGESSGSQMTSVLVDLPREDRVEAIYTCRARIAGFNAIAQLRPETADMEAGSNEDHTPTHLADLIRVAHGQLAADRRDKIYGLLGMVDEATRTALKPSYQKSKLDVFRDAAVHLLAGPGRADQVLYHCLPNISLLADDYEDHGSLIGGPSWVMDFSYPGRWVQHHFDIEPGEAAEETTPSARFLLSDESIMLVKATVVDTIVDFYTFYPTEVADQAHSAIVNEDAACSAFEDAYPLFEKAWALAAEAGWDPEKSKTFEGLSYTERVPKLDLLASLDSLYIDEVVQVQPQWTQLRYTMRLFKTIKDMLKSGEPEVPQTFFITRRGVCGVCVGRPRVGDVAAVLFRTSKCEIHFVLRPSDGATATATGIEAPEEAEKFRMVGVAQLSDDWFRYCDAVGKLGPETIAII